LTIKENNVYYLAGVVSYGGSSCDGVGVYTNVANYLGWLYSKMV
jgi:secreted trypsin-like serine protease